MDEEKKKLMRMKTIYKALEDGWTVKKSDSTPKTFEFTKGNSKTVDDGKNTNRRSISEPIIKNKKKET